MRTISKSIFIKASASKVWDVLTQDRYTRDWYTSFGPGVYAITDWQPGSKVLFVDNAQNGMAALVAASEPARLLDIEYTGIVKNGVEDLTSDEARQLKGGRETYRLSPEEGGTRLDITSDMDESMFEMMSGLWEKAFERMKVLAEA